MEISTKLWQKIEDSFHFKNIRPKGPKVYKKTYPTDEEQLDMNIDSKEIQLWSSQNLEILRQLQMDGMLVNLGYNDSIQNKEYLSQIYQELLLDSNSICTLDIGLLVFQNIKCLSLNQNNIQKLQNLPQSLQELHIHQNQITSIDRSLRLLKLQYLGIGLNKLNETSIGNFFYLEKLSENFPNLISLDVSCNLFCNLEKTLEYIENFKQVKILNLFGNPLCLSNGYPLFAYKKMKQLRFFDNQKVSIDDFQKLTEKHNTSSSILEMNNSVDKTSGQEMINIRIATLENLTGFYLDEQKVGCSYWVTYHFTDEMNFFQQEATCLDKGELRENEKYAIDLSISNEQGKQISHGITLNEGLRDQFLNKFVVKVHEKEPKSTCNEETGERVLVLENEQPIFEEKVLGVALVDLSEWFLVPGKKKEFQYKLELFPENALQYIEFFYPKEEEGKFIREKINEENLKQQQQQQQQEDSKKIDKKGQQKPAKKEDKKGAKVVTQEAKATVRVLEYESQERLGVQIDSEKWLKSIGPLLAISISQTNN